ncbi:uncharacterized protein [Henckelia pumila]|uniref:uncharacterized protein n=1 Tax=Henckelia pumila TaxID=405737 RepID=UPI003C6E8E63
MCKDLKFQEDKFGAEFMVVQSDISGKIAVTFVQILQTAGSTREDSTTWATQACFNGQGRVSILCRDSSSFVNRDHDADDFRHPLDRQSKYVAFESNYWVKRNWKIFCWVKEFLSAVILCFTVYLLV